MGPTIVFTAQVYKIQTLKTGDGSFRVTLDIPMCDRHAVMNLMSYDHEKTLFGIAMTKIEDREVQ